MDGNNMYLSIDLGRLFFRLRVVGVRGFELWGRREKRRRRGEGVLDLCLSLSGLRKS
jgi:hypothetical protein